MIVAGEASGDQHAADLVNEIKKLTPSVDFWGLGGSCMKRENVLVTADLVSLAVIGFSEVIRQLNAIRSIYIKLLADIDRDKPDIAILVDYPGFNIRLAKELKKRAIPVVYYISPQIWAWGKGRIKTIRETVSLMIVFFPFEETLYRSNGVPVAFAGHPCLDRVKTSLTAKDFRERFSLDQGKRTIALLPGSRLKEVKTLLPIMLKASALISKRSRLPLQFIVLAAPTVSAALIKKLVERFNPAVKIVQDQTYDGIQASDLAMVCSGTATLETAILGTPMLVTYKVNFLTWLYMRLLIKIPFIGLVNVVAGRKIVEEFIQFDATAQKLSSYCCRLLSEPEKLSAIKNDLLAVKKSLGETGAAKRAARAVKELLA